jgi:pimeloyl-ACP methyl ester carboxylesterase
VTARFTPAHRGGSGPPLVLLHGFTDTWSTWELVLGALERHHDVLAVTLPGHAGGPDLTAVTDTVMVEAVERAMDAAGFGTAHVAGNSLGGHVGLQLAARGRARSVVALAPAGGWDGPDPSLRHFLTMTAGVQAAAPHADALVATPAGRRRVSRPTVEAYEHIPPDLLAHQIRAAARCEAAPLLAYASEADWTLDAEHITCPVRIVWGTADRLLPWPAAAARFRRDWLPHADWVDLDGVGHCPQLDVPLETAQLILGFTT